MDAYDSKNLRPIGILSSVFKYKNGTPRQATVCTSAKGFLSIDPGIFNNPEHSLDGLAEFSHVWIIFCFHKNNNICTKAKVKPPRLDGVKKGLFATRCPYRPNPIGLTLAKIEKIEGSTIYFSGIDIIDGTPVLDIKPYIPEYDSPCSDTFAIPAVPCSESATTSESSTGDIEVKSANNKSTTEVAEWLVKPEVGNLAVCFTRRAHSQLQEFSSHTNDECSRLTHLNGSADAEQAIRDILAGDPRSSYRRHQCKDKLYYFSVDSLHVTCWFDEDTVEVLKVQHISKSPLQSSDIQIRNNTFDK